MRDSPDRSVPQELERPAERSRASEFQGRLQAKVAQLTETSLSKNGLHIDDHDNTPPAPPEKRSGRNGYPGLL